MSWEKAFCFDGVEFEFVVDGVLLTDVEDDLHGGHICGNCCCIVGEKVKWL